MLEEFDNINFVSVPRIYPFEHRVIVIRDRPPRHPAFEYYLNLGRADLERIMDGKTLPSNPKELTFFMPERWLSVGEQKQFMAAVVQHAQKQPFDRLTLITSNPLIISNFTKEAVRIVTY